MGTRCRLCAECCEDLVPVLAELELPARILQLFRVRIDLEDTLPTVVCRTCFDTVNRTWEFTERVHRAQEVLAECVLAVQQQQQECDEVKGTESVLADSGVQGQGQEGTADGEGVKSAKIKYRRKRKTTPSDEPTLSDCDQNDDGTVIPKYPLETWETYPWLCCECRLQTTSCDELRDHHANSHGQLPKYSCADCPKVYTKFSTFLGHVRTHRPKLKFCCDICWKWFPTFKQQETHRAAHGDERPFGCATCGKRFRLQSAMLIHARCHLPVELKNRHQCDQCPKRFGTKPNLMAHKRIHAGVREYTCDQCGKSFVQKGNLDNHLLTHTAARPYVCNTCGKAFKTLVRLRKHGSVHSGLKPHQCDVCGRQFRERGTLKEHHRIHTGAMPFTCEFCGKSFRFKGVLTTHRRQHTGERPYSCLECQHHFTNWPNYNKHMKRRHGINTSVTVRKPQSIPPTGMPQRNPPGAVLAPPQPVLMGGGGDGGYGEQAGGQFYPVLNLYNLSEELLQPRV